MEATLDRLKDELGSCDRTTEAEDVTSTVPVDALLLGEDSLMPATDYAIASQSKELV